MKRLLPLLLFLSFANFSVAQLKEFYITCNPADFQYIYDNYEQDIYIPATFEFNGTVWNNVSIRIRGDGSRTLPKKSLKLRFNDGAYIDGRTSLNINAEYEDPTYIQQYLASRLMQESGQYCFTAEHVRVYLNGTFFGLYLLNEAVDERFFEIRGLDPNGATYKAALDGSSLSIFDQPQYHWEQKTGPDVNMADLQVLINELNSTPQAEFGNYIDQSFNRSEVVNMITMNELLSLGSTYYHNYFMHHEPNADKWMMLPWDMDKTLLYYGSGFPYHRSSRVWEPDNPYHEKSIHDDQLLSEIRARIVTLESTIFNLAYVNPIIDSIQTVISASVAEDTTDNIPDVSFWNTKVNDYNGHFGNRASYLLTQIDEYPRNFTVERIGVAEPGGTMELHWTPSVSPISRPISYRFTLSDDPNIESNLIIETPNITDTLVTVSLPATEGLYYYKVQAFDGFNYVDGFDSYNPLVLTSNVPELVINEINYHSADTFVSGDWVEIHNPLTYSVDLEGWYLKDDQNDHTFELPAGAVIGPGQFVILATDTASFNFLNDVNSPVYGPITFGFGNSGDHLRLFHPSGVLVDEVFYADTTPWPWQADGYGPTLELQSPELDNWLPQSWAAWENRLGTPGAPNFTGTSVQELSDKLGLQVYPNPISGEQLTVTLSSSDELDVDIEIFDVSGKRIYFRPQHIFPGQTRLTISPKFVSGGVYHLRVGHALGSITRKIIYLENHY
ncbi:MAG: CotH kinase family protein [Flavobacteriales bacterium]|nr:CotH kinase family protein [Flavobacteriales bacterium]MCB9191727.1 CotH kinase family protein [Flavobacteriales bacterium]MCB9203611.1 CotH kinase family protein [Flavobacteriales bacterium]